MVVLPTDLQRPGVYALVTAGIIYYYASSEMSFPGKYREGVDIKWNGYVVAAPSVHPSGSIYQVDDMTEIRPISDLVGV